MKSSKAMKLIALLLVVAMAFSMLSACGKTDDGQTPADTQTDNKDTENANDIIPEGASEAAADSTVTIVIGADSGSLYPLANSQDMNSVMRCLYDVPADTLSDGSRIFRLIESIDTISETEYTLHLRQGVTFANGNPFTAEDFMFSAELHYNDPQFFLNVKSLDLEKTNIVDEYTIDFHITAFDPTVWTSMDMLYIFDAETFDADSLAATPNGTGPYELVEYVSNSHISFKAREDWWGGDIAIKNVNVLIMSEDTQKTNALITGDAQYSSIPFKDVEYVSGLGYNTQINASGGAYVAYLNASSDPSNPLNSPEARMAVYHAINCETINNLTMEGQSELTVWAGSSYFVDYEQRFADKSEAYKTGYDLEKAKELAEASGLVGKTIRVMTNGGDTYVTMAEIIQGNLAEIGVNVEIKNYDQATYFSLLMDQSNYEIGLFMLVGSTCLGMDLMPVYAGMFYANTWEAYPDFAALGAKGMVTADEAARGDIMNEMVDILNRDFPWFTICEIAGATARASNLEGVEHYLDGLWHVAEWYYTE